MEWYSLIAIIILTAIVIFLTFKVSYKKKPFVAKEEEEIETEEEEILPSTAEQLSEFLNSRILLLLLRTKDVYSNTLIGLNEDDRELLKKSIKEVKKINKLSKKLKNQSLKIVKDLDRDLFIPGSHVAQACDYLRETTYCLNFITNPLYSYLNNAHNPFSDQSHAILRETTKRMNDLFLGIVKGIREKSLSRENIFTEIKRFGDFLETDSNAQVVKIKDADMNTRTTMLYFGIIHETKNILMYLGNFIAAFEEFEKSLQKQE